MRFIPFLEKIPKQGKSLLAKIKRGDGEWYNRVIIYWGIYDDTHHIEDNHGAFLTPENVVYLCEDEVEEYETEETEQEAKIAYVFKCEMGYCDCNERGYCNGDC